MVISENEELKKMDLTNKKHNHYLKFALCSHKRDCMACEDVCITFVDPIRKQKS